mmetsp:Transcript_33687/g.66722  ORF Transcript_33687/g.66722 Transcript_33687/m.66722 type:complete len:174 (+) Transcript_33687:3-524(+)
MGGGEFNPLTGGTKFKRDLFFRGLQNSTFRGTVRGLQIIETEKVWADCKEKTPPSFGDFREKIFGLTSLAAWTLCMECDDEQPRGSGGDSRDAWGVRYKGENPGEEGIRAIGVTEENLFLGNKTFEVLFQGSDEEYLTWTNMIVRHTQWNFASPESPGGVQILEGKKASPLRR